MGLLLGKMGLQLATALLVALAPPLALAVDKVATWNGTEPAPGVYFNDYEPSFYVGFAPRTQDPTRVHLELARGNQQRLTLVLGPQELDAYLDNLLLKRDTVREMVANGIIRLTTNKGFDRFAKALADAGVETSARARDRLEPEAYRRKTVEIMGRLNPGRVFVIAIPRDRVIRHWFEVLRGLGDGALDSGDVRIEAANAILPGRVNLYELDNRLRSDSARPPPWRAQ